jgi:K+-transporting ATPase KdpF subunit
MTTTDQTARTTPAGVTQLDSVRGVSHRGERRRNDRLAELSRRHDGLCTSAVDAWEIAAGLEAQGMSDRNCLAYGYPDVFSLADALFARVPRRGSNRATESKRPSVTTWRCVMRGLLYALPAVVGIGVLTDAGVPSITVLLVAIAVGWGWSQAWSFLGHRSLGWIGDLAARALMRTGLLCGLVIMPVVVLVAARLAGAPAGAAVSGIAIGWYMVGAGVLLVFGNDRALLAALAPGTVVGILLLLGLAPWGRAGQMSVAGLSVLLVIGLAIVATSRHASTGTGARHARPSALPDGEDLLAAAPHLFYGVVCAAAVGLGPSTVVLLGGSSSAGSWYVALPVVLSMGAAELQLTRLMERTHLHVRTTTTPAEFARLSSSALAVAITGYLAVVLGLSVVALTLGSDGWPRMQQVILVGGYAALAACFFIALVLVATGRVLIAGACMAVGLAAYLLLALTNPSLAAVAYALTFGTVALVLTAVAVVRLRNPFLHL